MAAKPKLHGEPLATAKRIKRMLAVGPRPGQARRAWGREILELVRELAATNVEPVNFSSILPAYMAEAVGRERRKKFLAGCGVTTDHHGLLAAA